MERQPAASRCVPAALHLVPTRYPTLGFLFVRAPRAHMCGPSAKVLRHQSTLVVAFSFVRPDWGGPARADARADRPSQWVPAADVGHAGGDHRAGHSEGAARHVLPVAAAAASAGRARVLIYAFGVSLGTGAIAGLAPATLFARRSMADALRTRGSNVGHAPRVRQALVVVQVAMTVVLLCGAGSSFARSSRWIART